MIWVSLQVWSTAGFWVFGGHFFLGLSPGQCQATVFPFASLSEGGLQGFIGNPIP
jgi:hypothetical protein